MINLALPDVLGWAGNIFFILGSFLLARRKPIPCCVTNIIGNGIYIAVGIMGHLTSLTCISIFLLVLAVYGIYSWRNPNEKDKVLSKTGK